MNSSDNNVSLWYYQQNYNHQDILPSTGISSIVYSPSDIIFMAIITGIAFIGIPGNVFVMYVFGWRRGRKRSQFEFLLLILAFIDLSSLLMVPPSFFYLTITKYSYWHFGEAACKIVPSILQITVTVSQGMLVLICYERYSAIVKPFDNEQISTFRVFAWLCNVVFISIVFIYPYAYSFELISIGGRVYCAPNGERLSYLLVSSCLQIFRDFMSIVTMAVLSRQMNHALTYQSPEVTSWNRAQMSAKSRKVIRTVVIVFTILCLPVDILHLTYYVLIYLGVRIDRAVFNNILRPVNTALNLLQISNSVVNVFIYSKMHVFFHKIVIETTTIGHSKGGRSKTMTSIMVER